MAELRRATIRILSNYVRLAATVCLSLYLMRVLLRTVGEDATGLFLLLASTVSIPAIVEEAMSWSMIRELGAAHHGGDRSVFRRMFNSALALSALLAAGLMAVFALIMLLLPLMNIPPALLVAAQWFVVMKAIETAFLVLLSPHFNMYLVTERMVAYNFWLIVRRLVVVLGAVALFWLNAGGDPARGLVLFGAISAGLMILAFIISAAIITVQDRRLVPNLRLADRGGMKAFLAISGWNLAIQGSQTLVLPFGAILMNAAFGTRLGNVTFGTAQMLAGYARMVASGMTVGLDAVATRISVGQTGQGMDTLVRYSTLLHGLAVFPSAIVLGVLAHPLLDVWIGARLDDPHVTIPMTAAMVRILLIGFAIMLLCDCWTRILFGAGFVSRYAPIVILGNLCMPFLAMLFLAIFPADIRHTAVAWAFAAVYVVFYLGFIPRRTAQLLHMTIWAVIQPLVRPLVASMVCVPVLLAFLNRVQEWNLVWLTIAAGSYGLAYAAVVWFFVLDRSERARLTSAAGARLARRPAVAN